MLRLGPLVRVRHGETKSEKGVGDYAAAFTLFDAQRRFARIDQRVGAGWR